MRVLIALIFVIFLVGCTKEIQVPHTPPQPPPDQPPPSDPPETQQPDETPPSDPPEDPDETPPDDTPEADPCEGKYNALQCYHDLAIEKEDRELCKKAGHLEFKCQDFFILQEAVAARNKTRCVDIIDEELKDVCYYKVRNN